MQELQYRLKRALRKYLMPGTAAYGNHHWIFTIVQMVEEAGHLKAPLQKAEKMDGILWVMIRYGNLSSCIMRRI